MRVLAVYLGLPSQLLKKFNLSDELEFEFTKIVNAAETEIITKRIIFSLATRFYDPVGLISPIVLHFKLIFLELCQKSLRWDDPVDENICSKWQALVRHLREVGTISLKRCYCQSNEDSRSVELHVFADASESAYGSCTYLRCEHESSDCCNLVSSITRVSPLARQTIPRLELLACLVSARLSQSLRRALHGSLTVDRIVY